MFEIQARAKKYSRPSSEVFTVDHLVEEAGGTASGKTDYLIFDWERAEEEIAVMDRRRGTAVGGWVPVEASEVKLSTETGAVSTAFRAGACSVARPRSRRMLTSRWSSSLTPRPAPRTHAPNIFQFFGKRGLGLFTEGLVV